METVELKIERYFTPSQEGRYLGETSPPTVHKNKHHFIIQKAATNKPNRCSTDEKNMNTILQWKENAHN